MKWRSLFSSALKVLNIKEEEKQYTVFRQGHLAKKQNNKVVNITVNY